MALSSSSSVSPSRKLHHLGAGPSDGTKNACTLTLQFLATTNRFHPDIRMRHIDVPSGMAPAKGASTRELQEIMSKRYTVMAGVLACAAGWCAEGRACMRGASIPSMSSPESFQCSTSLMPGSCGCRLVKISPEAASHTFTICLSALITFLPDPPARATACHLVK